MPPPAIDVDSASGPKSFFRGLRVVGVGDCQFAVEDQVCGQVAVLVGGVVGVSVWWWVGSVWRVVGCLVGVTCGLTVRQTR